MRGVIFLQFVLGVLVLLSASIVRAENPYVYETWVVTYGQIAPLGVKQRGILINGQFPGPTLNVVTNDNVIITVINKLDDPLLITWNGVKQRKSSWQDGVLGTNCPIPPNSQWTYKMQMKDQIGTFTYFPSTLMHRAAGGFGGFNILARSVIPIPYPKPFEQFTLLVSDCWKTDNIFTLSGPGVWNTTMRRKYNVVDATTRCTIQVYPNSWSTILMPLDNRGMWNLRSAIWPRRYLGQETYFRVWNTEHSLYTEYEIPPNTLLCGKAKH